MAMEERCGPSHRARGSAVGLLGALALVGALAGCGTDHAAPAKPQGPGPYAPGGAPDRPARVTSAGPPGPHSGLTPAKTSEIKVSFFSCAAGQTAPRCTPVAATGSGAPPAATNSCTTIGRYRACIALTTAGQEHLTAASRASWRTAPNFVCRVSF
jgi:hypothetical protein